MTAKQLSVFIENRQGRLKDVLAVLKNNGINILSLSLADTSEYGLLRLIVSDPKNAKKSLSDSGFSTMLTDVFVVKIGHKAGSLADLVAKLSEKSIDVEYMYGLSTEGSDAYIVLKVSAAAIADRVFTEQKVITLSDEEISKIV